MEVDPSAGEIEVVLGPIHHLTAVETEWRRLEPMAKTSFFTSWAWIGTYLDVLPPEQRPALLRLASRGTTVALGLLGRRTARRHRLIVSRGLYLNSTGTPDYDCVTIEHNGLLAVDRWEDAAWAAFLNWFGRSESVGDELILPGLGTRLNEAIIEDRGLLRFEIPSRAFHTDLQSLGATGGEFAPLLSPNARYQLRRAIRDYGGRGALSLQEARSVSEALAWLDRLKALHIPSWTRRGKSHSFERPFFEKFHRALITRAFPEGRIQLLRLAAREQVIGYLYNFHHGNHVYAYQSGLAHTVPGLRPGAVSHALAIEHNFRKGAATYDFMAGSNQLKQSFATHETTMYWSSVRLPLAKYRIEHRAGILKAATQRVWKTNLV